VRSTPKIRYSSPRASQGSEEERPVSVSVIIANPEKFDGRRLRVIGILGYGGGLDQSVCLYAGTAKRSAGPFTAVAASAIALIARRTGDRSRDIDKTIRDQAISRLMALGIAEETIPLLSKCAPPERADAVRSFGESLPPGLQLVSSANCMLSVPALHTSGPTFSKPA